MKLHRFLKIIQVFSLASLVGTGFIGCSSPGPEPVQSFDFKFTGIGCNINGSSSFQEEVQKGASKQYTIQADDDYVNPKVVGELPDWVVFDEATCVLTITEMKDTCIVNFEATECVTFTFNGFGCTIGGDTEYVEKMEKGTFKNYNIGVLSGYKDPKLKLPVAECVTFDDTTNILSIANIQDSIQVEMETTQTASNILISNPKKDGFITQEKQTEINTEASIHITSLFPLEQSDLKSVKVKNQEISEYTFEVQTNPQLAILTIPGEQVIGDICIEFVSPEAPTPSSFEEDDWNTFLYYANQGVEKLQEAYQFGDPSEMIGLHRSIVINGIKQSVMVVGLNQDYQSYNTELQQFTNPVTITFQFDRLISDNKKDCLTLNWSDYLIEYNYDYWSSTINNNLNSLEDVVWHEKGQTGDSPTYKSSVYRMVMETDPVLAYNIKNTYRGVNTFRGFSDGYQLTVEQTKLFVPTLGNFISNEGINNTDVSVIGEDERELYTNEATAQYQFYSNNIGSKSITNGVYHQPFECLPHLDYNDEELSSWIASPFLKSKEFVWAITENQTLDGQREDRLFGVAPCFCI